MAFRPGERIEYGSSNMAEASSTAEAKAPTLGKRALSVAFSAGFWPYLAGSSIILFFPALGIYLATVAFDPKRRLLSRFTAEWGAHYLEKAPFAGVEVTGREYVNTGPAIYVSNHQSMSDTLALFSVRAEALWVSKVENFYAPFLGWNMLLNGFIPLKRGKLPSIMRMFRTCLQRLKEGHSLVVFPEGTRSLDGNLRSFYRGAFALSARSRVPIVPIVMEGTKGLLRKGSALIEPQRVRVTVLPPVDPSIVNYDSRRLRDLVREQMAAELARLRASA